MSPKPRGLPPPIRAALAPASPKCYRHCDREIRPRSVRSRLPGTWLVYACPGGAVSVVTYFELSSRDPTSEVAEFLRSWSEPASLVRRWDLRSARRHGPELGTRAERWMRRARTPLEVRGVYWRLYPYQDRRGIERRLFACFRRRHDRVVFFTAPSTEEKPRCPRCAGAANRRRVRRRR